jgi:cyclase
MVQRERVTEDIFVFTSDLYVQVNAAVIVTSDGVVVIDTLLYPDETQHIKHFIDTRINQPVRYVVNTHHHADHTTGTSLFEEAQVISHQLCRELLNTRGRESLQRSQAGASDFDTVQLVLPQVVFDDTMSLQVGDKALHFEAAPGHSPGSIVCWVDDLNVLFAADTVMPIPYFVDGDFDDHIRTLEGLQARNFENIVQGHGEIVLRGEVEPKLQSDIDYLYKLRIAVDKALDSSTDPQKINKALASIKVGACGKSHILLNGVVQQLHYQNVMSLANQRRQELMMQSK